MPHTVIADNAGGHLMQHGMVDLRSSAATATTARGDVCNKIGTYLKALAAHDNGVPFYVALPTPTIDWSLRDGVEGDSDRGTLAARSDAHERPHRGRRCIEVEVVAPGSPARNPGFDVTPARLVTGLITERGVAQASRAGLAALYPEHARP